MILRRSRGRALWSASLVLLLACATVCGTETVRAQDSLGISEPDLATRDKLYEQLGREVSDLERHAHILKLVVRLVGPTVVHIETEKTDALSTRIGGKRTIEEAGSGVVLRLHDDFYVLTNWHVIRDATLDHVNIRLSDGRVLNPSRVWYDAQTDVAVMSVSAPGLVPARLGNSDDLEIGDFVLAVGSPFGLSHSVTFGIVSAKGRRDLELGSDQVQFQDFIQTDAAINPGNSGGPLINLRGEVVGINTAIASSSGGNEGIGFSIPINMVQQIATQLIDRGSVMRAFLGVHLDRNYGPTAAAKLGLPRPRGALINGITPNSPAEAADLRVGDVILRFNGKWIESDSHLINLVSLTEVNRDIPVLIFRDRQEKTVTVRVGDRSQFEKRSQVVPPAEVNQAETQLSDNQDAEAWDVDSLGLTVIGLDAETAKRLRINHRRHGLVVTWVNPQGPAAGQIKSGEIIDQIGRQPIRAIGDLEAALRSAEVDQPLAVRLSPSTPSTTGSRTVVVQPNFYLGQ
ncbi:MAG: trypsin-like peptidase domain-containing protein [Pirellulales bacterium]|nr:trypsin-like peptidase domain-containing protein [Pirellulales bacterium]